MELIQLRYFLKAAETLNYTQAAAELFTSRQALRHVLGNLEKELGQSLFINDHNHLSLTEYGEYLLLASRTLMEDFDRMEGDVTRFFRQPVTLQVAFTTSLFPSLLPNINPILQEFMLRHPHIALNIDRYPFDRVMDAVEGGQIDCGVVLQMPCPRPNCSATVLRASDVAIGSGMDSPLFGKPELTAEDLATVPLIGMGDLERFAKPLWEDCLRKGITLDYRVVPDTNDALYQMRHSLASSFNTFLHDPNTLPTPNFAPRSRLTGYTWELVALCPKSRPSHAAARLFAAFIQEKYR